MSNKSIKFVLPIIATVSLAIVTIYLSEKEKIEISSPDEVISQHPIKDVPFISKASGSGTLGPHDGPGAGKVIDYKTDDQMAAEAIKEAPPKAADYAPDSERGAERARLLAMPIEVRRAEVISKLETMRRWGLSAVDLTELAAKSEKEYELSLPDYQNEASAKDNPTEYKVK